MEEKTKNIIYSVIAIILGLIVGGCTQVKAATNSEILEEFMGSFNVYVRTNLDYAYVDKGLEYPINIDNTRWLGINNAEQAATLVRSMDTLNVMKIRFCNIGETDNIYPRDVQETSYGPPEKIKIYRTRTTCSWTEPWEGGKKYYGTETEIQLRLTEDRGRKTYVDIDTGMHQLQYYVQLDMVATSPGIVSKIRYVFSDNMKVPEDAVETTEEQLKEIQNILGEGNFKKPNRDEVLSEYEEKEEELWEIIGVPNYNDINIDIDSNTNIAIWDLIIRIWNQNTAILTMVVTILSISILKLILNR